MADTKKKSTAKPRVRKPAAEKPAKTETAADTPLVELEAQAREAAGDDPLRALKNQRAKFNELFADADAKAQAAITEEAQVGLQVRGY